MTKVHKITVYIPDHGGVGADSVSDAIATAVHGHFERFAMRTETRNVEPSSDDPSNAPSTACEAFEKLFSECA